jgi:O-antigen/teichoic acid export membrane protein
MKRAIVIRFLFHAVSKGLSYLLLLIYANWFLKEEYGAASFWLSLFYLGAGLLFLGLPQVFVPFMVKNRNVMRISSLLFTLSVFAIPMLWWVIPPAARPLLFLLPVDLIQKYQLASLQSLHRHDLYQLTYIVSIVITIPCLFLFSGSAGILLSLLIGKIASMLLFWPWMRSGKGKRVTITHYLSQAWPVALVSYSFLLLFWVDSAILGVLSTAQDVADYTLAGTIASVIIMVPAAISMFILTRSSEKTNLLKTVKKSMRISLFLSLGLSILMVSMLPILLPVFFPAYQDLGGVIVALTTGILGYSLYSILFDHYTGRQQPLRSVGPVTTGVLVNLVLDILLIPRFGIWGIAAATVAAHLLIAALFLRKAGLSSFLLFFTLLPLVYFAWKLGIWGLLIIFLLPFLLLALGLLKKEDIKTLSGLTKPTS